MGDPLTGAAASLYQVCTDVSNPKTLERETRALWETMDEKDLHHSTLVIGEGPVCTYEQDGRSIEQILAWQWLLGEADA